MVEHPRKTKPADEGKADTCAEGAKARLPAGRSAARPTKSHRMSPFKRVSGRDVARHAGVSQATVSVVLNGGNQVCIAEETKRRVIAAAAELGYLPNRLASGFFHGHSLTIGVVILAFGQYPWSLWFAGLQAGLAPADYLPILLTTSWNCNRRNNTIPVGPSTSDEVANLRRILSHQVEGVIFYSTNTGAIANGLNELKRNRIPAVLVGDHGLKPGFDFVGACDTQIGCIAARHLLTLNRTSFGITQYDRMVPAAKRRTEGFVKAVKTSHIRCRVFTVDENTPFELAKKLPQLLKPPAAVFALNDFQAAAVIRAAKMIGWRVPTDLAVIGMGGFDVARYNETPITTINRNPYEVGLRAASVLLERIAGYDGPPRRIFIEPTLEVRESTITSPQSNTPQRTERGSSPGRNP